MRFPEFLKEGGAIGFVAPSFGCVIEPYHTLFLHTQKRFHEMGFQTVLGENCYADCGIGISNTPELCAKELMESYESKESDLLIACGGGELMCETVSFMDYEKLKLAKPKWFLGYSDNTNFTFLSTTLMDTAAIYGPCAPEFGQEPLHESLSNTLSLLKGEKLSFDNYELWELNQIKDANHPLAGYNLTEKVKPVVYQYTNPIEGRLVGGCLDCLTTLAGTRFDQVKEFSEKYKEDGLIWFLEACDLNVMSIRRALWGLKEAGWFSHVKAFLIGRPHIYGESFMGLDQYGAVTGVLGELGVPILMDLDIGHMPPQIPMMSGAYARVSVCPTENSVDSCCEKNLVFGEHFHIEYECK